MSLTDACHDAHKENQSVWEIPSTSDSLEDALPTVLILPVYAPINTDNSLIPLLSLYSKFVAVKDGYRLVVNLG